LRPRIGRKAIYATVGGAVMTLGICYVVMADLISFHTG
jgi:hypothetical protein